MEKKLNLASVQSYAKLYASNLLHEHFTKFSSISGQQILEMPGVKQVNLLVIYQIFENWGKEAERLKSPYFNYESGDVQEAMKTLMNRLSHHIDVKKEDAKKLYEKSVVDTLLLVITPYDFFHAHLQRFETIRVDELKMFARYIKINQALFTGLLDKAIHENAMTINRNRALELLNAAVEELDGAPDDIDPVLDDFSGVTSVTLGQFLLPDENPGVNNPDEPAEESFFSLNDQFSQPQNTLVDIHVNQKRKSFTESMALHHRFMFVKNLFHENEEAFLQAVKEIEHSNSYAEAFKLIKTRYAERYNWSLDSGEVKEFLGLVAARFE